MSGRAMAANEPRCKCFFEGEIFSQVTSAYTLLGQLGEPPLGQISPKWEKTCPDSRPTCMQNFTPLALSAAEKSVTIKRNKMTKIQKNTHCKLSISPYYRVVG